MGERFRNWLQNEIEVRGWSYRKLARQAGVSQSNVSRVATGDMSPSADFCIAVATALDRNPAHVLSLAGILPSAPPPATPGPVTSEIIHLLETLSPEQRQEVLRYIQFLRQK